jgi:hypothetical protein
MIEPCERCPIPEVVEAVDAEGQQTLDRINSIKDQLWQGYFRTKQEVPAESALPQQVRQELAERRQRADKIVPKILSTVAHVTLEVDKGREIINGIDCGSSPVTCPRHHALLALFERVAQQVESAGLPQSSKLE